MLPINKQISKYNYSSGNTVKYIVIHYTGNVNDKAISNAKYFSVKRNSSAHYFVDDTSIVQVVEDHNKSWHCGDGKGRYDISNSNSIGIEMCGTNNGKISETTINNTIELVKYLMKKYNVSIDKVVRHYDASRKNCPSAFSANNWARWYDFKDRLKEDNKQEIKNIGDDDMIPTVKLSACADSRIKDAMIQEIKGLQSCVGLNQDGVATQELCTKLPIFKGGESKGSASILQSILIIKGYLSKSKERPPLGRSVKSALDRFKKDNGIPITDELTNPLVWRKLLEY